MRSMRPCVASSNIIRAPDLERKLSPINHQPRHHAAVVAPDARQPAAVLAAAKDKPLRDFLIWLGGQRCPDAASALLNPRRRTADTAASSAGTKSRLATNVQARLINRTSPIDAVPGCCDSASEPNEVPVVSAENATARAVAEASISGRPARQFITK